MIVNLFIYVLYHIFYVNFEGNLLNLNFIIFYINLWNKMSYILNAPTTALANVYRNGKLWLTYIEMESSG